MNAPRLLSLIAALTMAAVSWASPCDAQELKFGVARPNLIALPEARWRSELEMMSQNGVNLVRTDLNPIEQLPKVVKYANELGIDLIFFLPMQHPSLYPPQTTKRPGAGFIPPAMPMSAIDKTRFAKFWQDHRTLMRSAGARVYAYEAGNEINTANGNGDYPVGPKPQMLNLSDCKIGACRNLEQGLRAYVDVLEIIRRSEMLDGAKLITAGMSDNPYFSAETGNGYGSTIGNFNTALRDFGAEPFIDGYAVHGYPIAGRNRTKSIEQNFKDAVAECLPSGTKKSCWITEWGIGTASPSCDPDGERDRKLAEATRVLKQLAAEKPIATAIYYDWFTDYDTNKTLSLFRCGRLISRPPA